MLEIEDRQIIGPEMTKLEDIMIWILAPISVWIGCKLFDALFMPPDDKIYSNERYDDKQI